MDAAISPELVTLLGITMVLYVIAMFAIGAFAGTKVDDAEDFVVAGRRLGLPLATATLLATWFGAGTLMAAADEVRDAGVHAATLDPFGAGICLLLVGVFFARPLWRMKLITLPELFGRRFDSSAEVLSAVLIIPPYLGWIAAQFMALASILDLFFGIPIEVGIALVAFVGTGYTLLGGMWAVTLTDAVQVVLLLVGLVVMSLTVAGVIGDGDALLGLSTLWSETPADRRSLIPGSDLAALTGWFGVLCAGALGNIPSQDVMQRVFSSRSAEVARWACLGAGALYLTFGLIPVGLGLAGAHLFGTEEYGGTIAKLAGVFLHPVMAVVFVLTLLSAVLSTIDSALLAPATILARDLLGRTARTKRGGLRLLRYSVVAIGVVSLGIAYMGENAYGLLESGYELGMVSLIAPLCFAVYSKQGGRTAVLASMLSGTALWFVHMAAGWETFLAVEVLPVPMGLGCTAVSAVAFPLAVRWERRGR